MKAEWEKKLYLFASVCFLITLCFASSVAGDAKTIKKNITILQGHYRKIPYNSTDVKKMEVSSKRLQVKPGDYSIRIRAKKAGKESFSFQPVGIKTRYCYTVTIRPLKEVRNEADKKLGNKMKRLPLGTKFACIDLNKDGIKELFYPGKIVYYNYQKRKCETQKFPASELYVSDESKMIFAIRSFPEKQEAFSYTSMFLIPSETCIFRLDDTGTGFREYTENGKEEYGAKNPYAYYDYCYDQDDYDYEDLSEDEVREKVQKKMPGIHKIRMKKR